MSAQLALYSSVIRSTSEAALRSDVTLSGRLLLERAGDLAISYAPFEHIERNARVVLVGITPGAQQAGNALIELRRRLVAGDTNESALAAAKVFASFSGPMRTNLVAMLDHIGLAGWLGVTSTAALWSTHQRLVHFTSALRYPVFVGSTNYNGHPPMTSHPSLRRMIDEFLREEAAALPNAVWIPLGPKAAVGVHHLVKSGAIAQSRVLDGLPHPSGANAERIAYFLGRKPREALSAKTDPNNLDAAQRRLKDLVSRLPSEDPGKVPA
ncbi:hypothetical protein EJ078_10920 [Mesorhizobium sp. M1A.F.Ca.IN.022.06.1.1]|uniref:hypothetical protein n=1 Tax=Mesorhizobium sp. M1A.F.Ca.IN.022.06.1.1 TaxID=2493680 RepID=UPI000F761D69|nr:hypothetical protein [Mesorhizobium sp. M1A.F.Ca.IN.022.06.1.1]AZO59690.1 hypothetical protein EJ078_10920 [Mesorhizobium sp. M1A.F.Ca.IN.022.06.1.1]